MEKTVVIIGAGAGGMTAAVQIRKLDTEVRIVVFEKSPYVSWAGCPTPYFISGELAFKSVIHHSADFFIKEHDIEVYDNHEVLEIDFEKSVLSVKGNQVNGEFEYDDLLLSLGGNPVIIPIEGYSNDLKGVFRLSHVEDAINIKEYIKENKIKKATIIGTGFIGLEMIEAFSKLGFETTAIESTGSILKFLNDKLKEPIYNKFNEKKIKLFTNTLVDKIVSENGKIKKLILQSGEEIETDILLISIGIQPNVKLLEKSGFRFSDFKKVYVNKYMQTYLENVYAIGDMIYTDHFLTKEKIYTPFGDVVDKQAIVAARNILRKDIEFKGVLGSMATSFFEMKIAKTGFTLIEAVAKGYDAKSIFVKGFTELIGFGNNKGGQLEIIYNNNDKTILGAAMVGNDAIAQFIDQFAIAITFKIPISELFNVDFAYSPTNSTVWNPILAAFRKVINK